MTVKTNVVTRDDLPKLIDELGLKVGVEIGVDEGSFSRFLLSSSHLDTLHSIDAWSTDESKTLSPYPGREARHIKYETIEEKARKTLAEFGGRSNVIKSISWDAAERFADGSLDFIYFDGCHGFTGFALDIIRWWPKVRVGGVISGHDYCNRHKYGVIAVVQGFAFEHDLAVNVTTEGRNPSWWAIKTGG